MAKTTQSPKASSAIGPIIARSKMLTRELSALQDEIDIYLLSKRYRKNEHLVKSRLYLIQTQVWDFRDQILGLEDMLFAAPAELPRKLILTDGN